MQMNDRDCRTCAYSRPSDDMYDNGCTAWDCEYINRREAIEIYKAYKNGELVRAEHKGE